MGTGKTTIGRELARGMGRKFIDVDHELERRFGMSVSEIFATKGEAAFRAGEEEVALELSRSKNRVIASGGGSILNPNILHAFQETGTLICLYTQRDDLVDRLARTDKRPLLKGKSHDEVAETVETLLERRDAVYRQVKIRIDTTHLTPMSAAGRIQELLASQARAIKHLDDFVDLT
jgi:shikimate kinase